LTLRILAGDAPSQAAHGWKLSCALQPHELHEPAVAGAAAAAHAEQEPPAGTMTEPTGLGAPEGVPNRTL
jgi:hypothetical protein